jgi:hypothetical protein
MLPAAVSDPEAEQTDVAESDKCDPEVRRGRLGYAAGEDCAPLTLH